MRLTSREREIVYALTVGARLELTAGFSYRLEDLPALYPKPRRVRTDLVARMKARGVIVSIGSDYRPTADAVAEFKRYGTRKRVSQEARYLRRNL